MVRRHFILIATLATAAAEPLATPLRPAPKAQGTTLFRALPAKESGVDFVAPLAEQHPQAYLYYSGFGCASVCLGDVDGDLRPDLFFTNGPGENALYLQKEPLHFTKADLGLGGRGWAAGSALVDIDNDSDLDLYVCNYDAPNELHLNQSKPGGALHFVESAKNFGLDVVNASLAPAFADYDRDGDLDLFLLTNQFHHPKGRPKEPPYRMVNGQPQVLPEFARYYALRQASDTQFSMDAYGQPDRLYRNDGGVFADVTAKAGISGIGHGLSATWWDYNADGWPDLYVGNDFVAPDQLYRNNRDGTFAEVLGQTMPACTWSSMGADSADINNDGWPDFFSADMAATTHFKQKVNMGDMSRHLWLMENGWPRQIMRNMLYLNTGTDRFMEIAFISGTGRSDWTWAAKLADFDNDGWVDLYLTNGMVRNFSDADIPAGADVLIGRTEWDLYRDAPPMKEKNLAFRNTGELRFEDVSQAWGLDLEGISYGAAHGDLDNDGDLDLVVLNLQEPVSLYVNQSTTGQRVAVELVGQKSNRAGLGATVRLEAGGVKQMRFLSPMTGFQSCNQAQAHFGLGPAKKIDRLTVDWPSGARQEFKNLAAGQRYVIMEAAGAKTPEPPKLASQFTEVSQKLGLDFTHREARFDDFQHEPLLPGRLSQFGPGQAWGDANGDGRDDLYIGGAAGQAGALFVAHATGGFQQAPGPWAQDAACEDMGAVWLDADVDGDLDLYVGSGGVEASLGEPALRDRLYLNQGGLRFARAAEDVLPPGAHSTSAVVASDFDGDGDLDLFVGARSVPGQYPITPVSQLLRNDSAEGKAKFTDVADTAAPGLSSVGLVTGALWSDVDRDGKADLLVTCEWGAVRLFLQRAGKLLDVSEALGLTQRTGWWNGLASGDLDGDGDMDYIVQNVGYNTKYGHPTAEKPSLLYYGDMDGTGRPQLIEAKAGKEAILPVRGRSCSSKAMPFIADKFKNYRAFAAANLEEIYTEPKLGKATKLAATEFASGVLLNDSAAGQVALRWVPLPWLAQAAPNFGCVANDFDGDGSSDVAAIGNLFSREPETGLWRGALGTMLRGDGKGGLEWLSPSATGVSVPDDGKSLSQADINADGRPDLVAAQNNGRLLAFANGPSGKFLAVRLQGPKGNPTGVGAVITLSFADGSKASVEVQAGSGYLAQSSPTAFFGLGQRQAKSLAVAWPGGAKFSRALKPGETRVEIEAGLRPVKQ